MQAPITVGRHLSERASTFYSSTTLLFMFFVGVVKNEFPHHQFRMGKGQQQKLLLPPLAGTIILHTNYEFDCQW